MRKIRKLKMEKYNLEKSFNIKRFIVILLALVILGYGFFNARNIIMGPTLEIFSPAKDLETNHNPIEIIGQVKNATFVSLNEKPISIDTEGFFEEKLLLSSGFNTIQLRAKDRFKNEIVKSIKVYYIQSTSTNEIDKINME
jgi:hypothetical protein